ncbi:SIR2 family protein [Paenibacillus sp. FSL H7-0942]|uniref:SIR2 family protein n=1 Tax=Paenibacillus sp. FSL H7-0942 TaxID=2921444 RepID=UPI0032491B73
MELNKIIESLLEENKTNKSYEMLETLIMKVLQQHFHEKGKELIPSYIIKNDFYYGEFDGFAPDGTENLEGSTIFEVKFYRSKSSTIKLFAEKNLEKINNRIIKSGLEVRNIVFIITLELNEEEKEKLKEQFNKQENINIEVWDLNDLTKIFELYPQTVNETYENISKLLINTKISTSIKESTSDWKSKQRTSIEQLKKAYTDDDLVLFLGAGVSIDTKIASWDNLVNDLLVNLIGSKLSEHNVNLSEAEKAFIVEKLKNSNGNSPLLMARYIRKGLEDVFSKILVEILYKNCIDTSDLLDGIAQLCLPVRNRVGIRGVVNYNFDDLLEYNLKEYKIKFRSIYREADLPLSHELGIYHVHGFLPRNSDEYNSLSKSLLVFSEEGYHDLMLDPYNWSNLVQLNYLRENTCLFIGLSMTDPNLRRLLDIAVRKQEENLYKHFVFMKRESYVREEYDQTNINNTSIEKFDVVNQKLQEDYYKELGLNIVWYDSYKEIPNLIKQIKE